MDKQLLQALPKMDVLLAHPALEQAGEVYVERLKDGFDMRY